MKSLTYASYAGKVKLDRNDNGTITVRVFHRQLDKGWHSQQEVYRKEFGPMDYDQARRIALVYYCNVLEMTIAWAEQAMEDINDNG